MRWLNSGEYIQMSGRAGRRNKDSMGLCIMVVDDFMEPDDCRDIIQGEVSLPGACG